MLLISSPGDLHLQEGEKEAGTPFTCKRWLPAPTPSIYALSARKTPASVTSGQGWDGEELNTRLAAVVGDKQQPRRAS